MTTTHRAAVLAGTAATGLAAALLQMPAASAQMTGAGYAASNLAHTCGSSAKGQVLKIRLGLSVGDNGRDVEAISVRATDDDESGSYDNNKVHLKKIRLILKDQDGVEQLDNTVAPSSPASIDVGSAGEGAGKVTAKVKFKVKGTTYTRSCFLVID